MKTGNHYGRIKQVLSLLLALSISSSLAMFWQVPEVSACYSWSVGQRVGLKGGSEIRVGSGLGYRIQTIVPNDDWLVDIIGGPRYADGQEWWDTSRAKLDGGGTGWLYKSQAGYDLCGQTTPGKLVLIQDLSMTNTTPAINQETTGTYRVKNTGGQAITIEYLGIQGRLDGNLNGVSADFNWVQNLTLQPGEEYTYSSGRSFNRIGSWRLRPNYRMNGGWSDVHRENGTVNELWVNVQASSPGRLVLIQDLAVSAANPALGQEIQGSYRVKNDGGAPITIEYLGIQGRLNGDINGTAGDFNWVQNLTLLPGQEYVYSSRRSFDISGNWRLIPNYRMNNVWSDVQRGNGTINPVWINVQTAPYVQTWFPQVSGIESENFEGLLNDIFFSDIYHGWAVGMNYILTTNNGGKTWRPQHQYWTSTLGGVYFANNMVGWAVGGDGNIGTILSTTNGGRSWSSQNILTSEHLIDIDFVDSQNGWVVGRYNVVLHTSDGGLNWTRQTTPNSFIYGDAVDFWDINTGWIVTDHEGSILYTSDGGSHWVQQPVENIPNNMRGVSFISANEGWTSGYSDDPGCPDSLRTRIFHTVNAGNNWEQISSFCGVSGRIKFVDSRNGWLTSHQRIFSTNNGGRDWTEQAAINSPSLIGLQFIHGLYFLNNDQAWAVSDNGIILHRGPEVPIYTISGKVTNSSGVPIAGVVISSNLGNSVVTDSSGNYLLNDLGIGDYTTTASKSGYSFSPPTQSIKLMGNAVNINFTGTTQGVTYSISGHVLNNNGAVIPYAEVSTNTGKKITSNSNGYYVLTGLAEGRYILNASKSGYGFTPILVSVPPSRSGQDIWGFINSECSATAPAKIPIMLVTGWGGSKPSLRDDENLKFFESFLQPLGYKLGCNLFYAADTSPKRFLYDDMPLWDSNAKVIRDNLCSAYEKMEQNYPEWSGYFEIVAHSYGGLRARAFLETPDLYGKCPPTTTQKFTVDNLFTLGTPHGGEVGDLPLSSLIGLIGLGSMDFPAISEMLPTTRESQNQSRWQPPGVSYVLISGDGRLQSDQFSIPLRFLYETFHADSSPNDLAVHGWSSDTLTEIPSNYPNLRSLYTDDVHGRCDDSAPISKEGLSCLALGLNLSKSYVSPEETFLDYIWQIIWSHSQSAASNLNTDRPTASVNLSPVNNGHSAQAEPTIYPPIMDISSGAVSHGQVTSGTFEINGGETQVLMVSTSEGLELDMIDPNGDLVSTDDPYVEIIKGFDTGFGWMDNYYLLNAIPGTWSYTIKTNNLTETIAYRLLAVLSTPIIVTPVLPDTLPNNSPLNITATVTYSETTPVIGGTVTARVLRPDSSVEVISLLDDGAHQDGAPGDGVFGGSYTQTGQGGIYGLLITAEGSYNGEKYIRTATGVTTVNSNNASLGTQYSDQIINHNYNGTLKWLDVSVPVNVNQAGTYAVSAELVKGSTFITSARAQLALQPGSQILHLRFSGDAIIETQLDGPYTIRNLILLDETNTTLLIQKVDTAYETAAYQYIQFRIFKNYLPAVKK